MAPRQDLHNLLASIPDVTKVYFQPPTNIVLTYPCIVYKRDLSQTKFADNVPYSNITRYQVTVIDADPDSAIPPKVAALPLCLFIRFYTADNLNHDVFNIFF